MRKTLLLVGLLSCIAGNLFADLTFRNQRRDMFRVLPINENSIVFLGNSITQGNEWAEAFNSDDRLVNRGISGNRSIEILNNLDYVAGGKPAKVFLMIGINDGADPGIVVPIIRKSIELIQRESPATEIYIQSILPHGGRENVRITNDLLKLLCDEKEVSYIDVFSKLSSSPTSLSLNSTYTNDNLHLMGTGYRKWVEDFEQYTGIAPTIQSGSNITIPSAHANYVNQRVSNFALMPVKSKDIIMLGDYHVNTGEWRELLRNPNVKSRGIGVNIGGTSISLVELKDMIPHVIKNNPAKIFISCGSKDLEFNNRTIAQAVTNYTEIISSIRQLAPQTELYIQSLLPRNNSNINSSQFAPFNEELKKLAEQDEYITYVDIYSVLESNGVLDAKYAWFDRGLNGRGYLRWAQVLSHYINDEQETTAPEAYDLIIALSDARQQLYSIKESNTAGSYPEDQVKNFRQAIESASVLAFDPATSHSELHLQLIALNNAARSLQESTMKLPLLSSENEEHWYKLSTPLRSGTFVQSTGAGMGLISVSETNFRNQQWKFTLRSDNRWNIINRADSSFIDPSAATNTQLKTLATEPTKGWTLKAASGMSKFIITSDQVQLNQTTFTNNMIYNWGGGSNTEDNGCQFLLSEVVTEPEEEPVITVPEALLTLVNIVCSGQEPVVIPANKTTDILAYDSLTVAIDFTPTNTNGDAILVAASNPNVNNKFFGIGTLTNFSRVGVRFVGDNNLEGWYTQNYSAPGARHQLVITMTPGSSNYNYYMDGTFLRNVSGMGEYGYYYFGKIPTPVMYLGGVVSANAPNRYPFTGTIHSVQFFQGALSAAQVQLINYNLKDATALPGNPGYKNFITFQDGNLLRIESNEPLTDPVQVNLIDLTGKQAFSKNGNELPISLHLNNLPKGVYILRIDSNFKIYREKIQVM
jgi:lysophospholipase L1-like esterase